MLNALAKRFPPAYRFYNRVRGYRLHSPDLAIPFSVLGSEYGGWAVPDRMLAKPLVVYSVGVGEDISFDLALADNPGVHVYLFDPTPVAKAFVEKSVLPVNVSFVPIGLAEMDGELPFEAPEQPQGASYSRSTGSKPGRPTVDCEVLSFASLKRRLSHSKVDLLKMDIEGFEYAVIEQILANAERPECLLVEFHHQSFGFKPEITKRAVEQIRAAGYRAFWISDLGREYGFLKAV